MSDSGPTGSFDKGSVRTVREFNLGPLANAVFARTIVKTIVWPEPFSVDCYAVGLVLFDKGSGGTIEAPVITEKTKDHIKVRVQVGGGTTRSDGQLMLDAVAIQDWW